VGVGGGLGCCAVADNSQTALAILIIVGALEKLVVGLTFSGIMSLLIFLGSLVSPSCCCRLYSFIAVIRKDKV